MNIGGRFDVFSKVVGEGFQKRYFGRGKTNAFQKEKKRCGGVSATFSRVGVGEGALSLGWLYFLLVLGCSFWYSFAHYVSGARARGRKKRD